MQSPEGRRRSAQPCPAVRPEIPTLPQSTLAVRFFGGSTTIDGVTITFTDGSNFRRHGETRFLAFLLHVCERPAITVEYSNGWFEVTSEGRLVSSRVSPGVKEVLNLRTVQGVREWMASRR